MAAYPTWVTIPEVRQKLADTLSVDAGELPDKATTIVADSLASAAAEVSRALQARGYTPPQIDRWDGRREFTIDIALFWALTKLGSLANYSDLGINKLDRRKELREVGFTVDGILVQPGPAASNTSLAVGRLSEAGYRFNSDTEF